MAFPVISQRGGQTGRGVNTLDCSSESDTMAAAQPTYGPRYWDKCAWDRPTGWEEDSPIKKSQMTGAEQDAWYEAWSDRLREWW